MSTRYHDIVHAALDPDLSHPSFFGAVQDEFAYVGERACVTPDRPTPTPDSATTHAQDSFPSNRAHADVQHIVNNVMRELFHDALSGRQPRQSLDEHGLEDAMETVVSKALYEALSGGGRSRDTGIDEKRMEESFAQMKIEVAASSDYHPSDLVSSAVPWEDATSAQGEDDDDTTDIRIDNEVIYLLTTRFIYGSGVYVAFMLSAEKASIYASLSSPDRYNSLPLQKNISTFELDLVTLRERLALSALPAVCFQISSEGKSSSRSLELVVNSCEGRRRPCGGNDEIL